MNATGYPALIGALICFLVFFGNVSLGAAGIGVVLDQRSAAPLVIAVVDGSPAAAPWRKWWANRPTGARWRSSARLRSFERLAVAA